MFFKAHVARIRSISIPHSFLDHLIQDRHALLFSSLRHSLAIAGRGLTAILVCSLPKISLQRLAGHLHLLLHTCKHARIILLIKLRCRQVVTRYLSNICRSRLGYITRLRQRLRGHLADYGHVCTSVFNNKGCLALFKRR